MLNVMIFYRLSQQLCSSDSISFSSSLDFMLMCMLELIFISGNYCLSFVFVQHDTFFASNGNWEKIRAPDGIRTDDPP